MSIPTQDELDKIIAESGPIRLGCSAGCFRDDCDGVRAIPPGWADVREVQSLKDSLTTYDDSEEEPAGYSVLDWETHVGVCPDCAGPGPDLVVNDRPAREPGEG